MPDIFSDPIDATDQAPREFATGSKTGFFANLAAGFDQTLQTGLSVSHARRRSIAYDDILKTVNADRPAGEKLTNPYFGASWGSTENIRPYDGWIFSKSYWQNFRGVSPQEQEQRIWADIADQRKKNPGYLPGIPKSRDEFEQHINTQANEKLAIDENIGENASVWGSAAHFVGAIGGGMRDPLNILTLPFGAGAAKTIIGAGIRQGAVNAAIGLAVEPGLAENAHSLGQEYGLEDVLTDTRNNFGLGVILGSGAKAIERPLKAIVEHARSKFKDPTLEQADAINVLDTLDGLNRESPFPQSDINDAKHLEILQGHIDALEHGAPPPATRIAPVELKRPTDVTADRYDPRELTVDAQRFQFKAGADQAGVTDRLSGVKEWSPVLSGKAVVWVDNEGKAFVADGHQRVGLANRLLKENPAADIKIDAVTLKESDGISAEMARTWAALKNVAEGSGSEVDAAKIFRTTGTNTPLPLPPRSPLVRDARALASLSDDAFGMVVNEVVPAEYGTLVGRLAPDQLDMHAAYLQLIHRLQPQNLTQAESIVRQAMSAGATRETQLGLFGEEVVSRSLYLERARVLDNALRRLKTEKRTFKTLIDAKGDIEAAGNQLAGDANKAKVDNNAQALEILTRLAHRTGPVSDALGDAAGELAAGRNPKAATDRFIAALDGLNLSELARGVERGAPGGGLPDEAGRGGGAPETDERLYPEPTGPELGTNPLLDQGADLALETHQAEAFSDPHNGAGVDQQIELLGHDVRNMADEARQAAKDAQSGKSGANGQQAANGAPEPFKPAPAGTALDRAAATAGQRGKSVEELLAHAAINQGELGTAGDAIAAATGARFENPGVKSAERTAEKQATEGYADVGEMLDLARGAFVVESADQADQVAAKLLEQFPLFDKGWQRTMSGYVDRKLIVQFPNGGVAEVQIVPKAVWDWRKAEGHKLYTEARDVATPAERALELNRQMTAGYDAALASAGFDGISTSGNALEKAATSSGEPSTSALRAKAGEAGAQAPAENTSTLPVDQRANGRSSSSRSDNLADIENPPAGDVGTAGRDVNAAVTEIDPLTDPAVLEHNRKVQERASSQDNSAGDKNGSGPSFSSGKDGGSAGGAGERRQEPASADKARSPAGDETTTDGLPPSLQNDAIMEPPSEQAANQLPVDNLPRNLNEVDPAIAARDAELARLAANSPLRNGAEQADVDGLALFDQVRSPELFALDTTIIDDAIAPELRTVDDMLADFDRHDAALDAIEKCMA